jgi:hypothetical protein
LKELDMPINSPRPGWEQRLRAASVQVEEEVQRAIAWMNDEAVPEIRRGGSDALRAAAVHLAQLAQKMEEHSRRSATPPPPPPPIPPDGPPR